MQMPEPVQTIVTDIVMEFTELLGTEDDIIFRTIVRPGVDVRVSIILRYEDEERIMAERTVITFAPDAVAS